MAKLSNISIDYRLHSIALPMYISKVRQYMYSFTDHSDVQTAVSKNVTMHALLGSTFYILRKPICLSIDGVPGVEFIHLHHGKNSVTIFLTKYFHKFHSSSSWGKNVTIFLTTYFHKFTDKILSDNSRERVRIYIMAPKYI
jgi:hypothetical protein